MAGVRRSYGFVRYALSVQYHGSSFLGFSYQGPQGEDCILPDGTDLRGYRSVEGRLRDALGSLVGDGNFENIQVSSRTDRGVHALKNTFHVDIRQRSKNTDEVVGSWDPRRIVSGLNFYLGRQYRNKTENEVDAYLHYHNKTRGQPYTHGLLGSSPPRRHSPPHEVRLLGAAKAPLTMKNNFYTGKDDDQPALVDWNARFSATRRAYAYRIFHQPSLEDNYGIPFEWDRSWVLRDSNPLDIEAMREAALYLTGTHDFTSFRGKKCQRESPVVTMKQIVVKSQPKGALGMTDLGEIFQRETSSESKASLVTIGVVGDSFLYRQVRNMVGCLVSVGRGKLDPTRVRRIFAERDRTKAPLTAPAHGLFLVDVQHGDFVF